MDLRQHSEKEELIRKLASARSLLTIPDTRQLVSQSKVLLHAAGKLPATMQARPARSLVIIGAVACIVALFVKPKRRRRKRAEAALALQATRPVKHQLLSWTLGLSQPLLRVWLTERVRRWMKRRS